MGELHFLEVENHILEAKDKKMLNQNLSMVDATIFGLGLNAHQSTYLLKISMIMTK